MLRLFPYLAFLILFGCHHDKYLKVENVNEEGLLLSVHFIDSDSLKQGSSWSFYDNGIDTFERVNYVDGKVHGKRLLYYASGQPEIEETYDNGTLNGRVKTYFPNGVLAFDGNYVNGVLQGKVITYYPSGTKKEEVTFRNNEENGPFIEYYRNGQQSWTGSYLNGENEFGELMHWDSTGILIKKMICDSLAVCRTTWSLEKGDIVLD